MGKSFHIFLALIVLMSFKSQAYESVYNRRLSATTSNSRYPSQLTTAQRLQFEAIRKEFDGVYEQFRAFNMTINDLKRKQTRLENNVSVLERQLADRDKENQKLRAELTALKQRVQSQDNELRGAINNVVDQVAKETATVLETVNKQDAQSASTNSSEGGFQMYTVQRGATLGAISKAYKCSVNDIKRVNNLKNDVIYVGQKLKIPR